MRGGERCLEIFCELFPDVEIYTLLHVKGSVSSAIEQHPIRTSFIQRLPFHAPAYRYYLPLFPTAIESFDLNGYDLVISSSHCVAKGVRVPEGTCHVAYLYTPMRYIWDQYEAYFSKGQAGRLARMMMFFIRNKLQSWDVASNDHVHGFIAISEYVAQRIQRCYGREATVVHPPVDWHSFQASDRDDGFYLMVAAFAPYKRIDLAIEAANTMGFRLKIIGAGQYEKRLRRMAGPTVELLGWQSDEVVREHYARCKALIFPGEEDFGIVPLEAMACGKPVIAYGKGGARETIVPINESIRPLSSEPSVSFVPTGVFFYEQTVEALINAIRLFEHHAEHFEPEAIRAHVAPFDRAHFKEKMRSLIKQYYQQFHLSLSC